jgi:ABC-type multidrug transport system ATPase subunit
MCICTGMMVALMGASGAGKSTLLDVLANKKTHGTIAGELLINGRPRDETFERVAAYVEQFDSHSPFSTVREALRFSGRLRLPRTVSNEHIESHVTYVLDLLDITHLQDEIIGM